MSEPATGPEKGGGTRPTTLCSDAGVPSTLSQSRQTRNDDSGRPLDFAMRCLRGWRLHFRVSDFDHILGSQEFTLLKRENDVYRVG